MRLAPLPALLLAAWLAPAAALAEAVDYQLVAKVLSTSRDRPALLLVANEDVDDVQISLSRDDGKRFNHRTGKLRSGQSKRVTLDLPPSGERHFKGKLVVKNGAELREAELDFAAEIVTPAKLLLDKAKVDLNGHTLELSSDRKIAKVEVEVTSDQGEDLGKTELPFDDAAPGIPVKVEWRQAEGTPMKIALRVYDPDDFYSGIELYPWRFDIPHEEVNFASGSFKLEASEEPKLTASLALIRDAVGKYGRYAEVKLYVAGHTDTVGAKDANRSLSLNRARAISGYFRAKGLRIPVFYEGFGEEALKVATPDETDELQNRRVEYIVAIEPPSIRGGGEAWKPLR